MAVLHGQMVAATGGNCTQTSCGLPVHALVLTCLLHAEQGHGMETDYDSNWNV